MNRIRVAYDRVMMRHIMPTLAIVLAVWYEWRKASKADAWAQAVDSGCVDVQRFKCNGYNDKEKTK